MYWSKVSGEVPGEGRLAMGRGLEGMGLTDGGISFVYLTWARTCSTK